jgi:hypothetical protein
MTVDQRSAFERTRAQLAETIEAGAALEDVEGKLERVPVRRDARDALWLLAWHAIERRERRHADVRQAAKAPRFSRLLAQ